MKQGRISKKRFRRLWWLVAYMKRRGAPVTTSFTIGSSVNPIEDWGGELPQAYYQFFMHKNPQQSLRKDMYLLERLRIVEVSTDVNCMQCEKDQPTHCYEFSLKDSFILNRTITEALKYAFELEFNSWDYIS